MVSEQKGDNTRLEQGHNSCLVYISFDLCKNNKILWLQIENYFNFVNYGR